MFRDSNSGHQLLLPTADWCPTFATRTTQVFVEAAVGQRKSSALLFPGLEGGGGALWSSHPRVLTAQIPAGGAAAGEPEPEAGTVGAGAGTGGKLAAGGGGAGQFSRRAVPVPAAGGAGELTECELLVRPLDYGEDSWRMQLVSGAGDGRQVVWSWLVMAAAPPPQPDRTLEAHMKGGTSTLKVDIRNPYGEAKICRVATDRPDLLVRPRLPSIISLQLQ